MSGEDWNTNAGPGHLQIRNVQNLATLVAQLLLFIGLERAIVDVLAGVRQHVERDVLRELARGREQHGLAVVRERTGLPILTDVHEAAQCGVVAEVVDVLQIPAFLCRQTDFIRAVAQSGKPVNIKKGQFLSPWEMQNVVDKARSTGNAQVMVCERGFTFGYNNLVSDMRAMPVLRATGCPVVFDATHSVQLPGGQGASSGGQREFVPVLARAAVAAGVAGVFMETHPDPAKALSDGPNAWPLKHMRRLLETLMELDAAVKKQGFAEQLITGQDK